MRLNTGKPFERMVETILTQYGGRGVLSAAKVDPPLAYSKRGIIHKENPFVDYVGVWSERTGRAMFFEAKSTKEPKLNFADGHFTDKQRAALRRWHNCGAAAFVLWECGGGVWFADWPRVAAVEDTGRRHLKLTDCLPVPAGVGWVIYDFAVTMRSVWP